MPRFHAADIATKMIDTLSDAITPFFTCFQLRFDTPLRRRLMPPHAGR